MLIDRFLPEYDWNEVHSIEIRAASRVVLDALRRVTAGEIRLLRVMLGLREIRAGAGSPVARCIEREGEAPPQYDSVVSLEKDEASTQATVEFVALMAEEADAA